MKNSTATQVAEAERLCEKRSLRLTALRRRVLQIVCDSPHPPKAYDILRLLGDGARPPTVYRALDFLETHGFLHKIKSRATYFPCEHPHKKHGCYFLLCKECGRADECCGRAIDDAVSSAASGSGFTRHAAAVEIEGVCPECKGT